MSYRLLGILSRSKYLGGSERPSPGIRAMKSLAVGFLIIGVGMYIVGKMMGHAILPPIGFLAAMLGGFLMLGYQFSGARWGAAMVTILCLTFASCTAVFVVGMSNSPSTTVRLESPATSAANLLSPTAADVTTSVRDVEEPALTPPSVPRLVTTQVKSSGHLYIDERGIAHRSACSQRGSRKVLPSVAKMSGHQMHSECSSMSELEYETIETVHPEWREYERRLAAKRAGRSSDAVVDLQTLSSGPSTSSPRPSGSSSSSSSGTVQVRGYTRKDGTYVPPHPRKKPSG